MGHNDGIWQLAETLAGRGPQPPSPPCGAIPDRHPLPCSIFAGSWRDLAAGSERSSLSSGRAISRGAEASTCPDTGRRPSGRSARSCSRLACTLHRNAHRAEFLGRAEAAGGMGRGRRRVLVVETAPGLGGARPFMVPRRRSVSSGPGNGPLMVSAVADRRARHAGDEASEAAARRAAVAEAEDVDRCSFTELEVMFTIRPKPRLIMPSTDALMNSIGVSILASIALIQSSRFQSRKSPGGGPPALLADDVRLRTGCEDGIASRFPVVTSTRPSA